jgi:threonyl-tRNA synthetase
MGQTYQVGVGDAAFYGPKIDFQVKDAHRREFTNSTVQIDFQLPERFELEYVAEDGSRQRPVMVHRGAAGSMERLFSYLIERYVGAFPTWLHPVQVVVAPLTDAQHEAAREISDRMRRAKIRVELDARNQKVDRKVRDAKLQKVPYIVVIGPRDVEAGVISVRNRADERTEETVEAFVERVTAEIADKRR